MDFGISALNFHIIPLILFQARLLFVNLLKDCPVDGPDALDQINEVLRSVVIIPEEQALETQVT